MLILVNTVFSQSVTPHHYAAPDGDEITKALFCVN